MIIAAAPGGVTSNILTAFARGDVALSISLTAVTSLICVITIPLIVVFAHAQFMGGEVGDVSVTGTAVSVFLIVTVPVIIGLCARRYSEGFALRIEGWASRISTALFVIVLIGAIVQQRENIVPYFQDQRKYYIVGKTNNLSQYDQIEFYIKSNDNNYEIRTIAAGNFTNRISYQDKPFFRLRVPRLMKHQSNFH